MTRELERTYRESKPRLLRFIRSRVASAEEAEDILQEIFARALSSFSVTEPIENLLGWLVRAAQNRIVDWYRKKKRQPVTGDEALAALAAAQALPADDRAAMLAELQSAIGELPDAQRQVVVEQALEGRTFREIAESTGVPLGTLLARKQSAVRSLRRRLEDFR